MHPDAERAPLRGVAAVEASWAHTEDRSSREPSRLGTPCFRSSPTRSTPITSSPKLSVSSGRGAGVQGSHGPVEPRRQQGQAGQDGGPQGSEVTASGSRPTRRAHQGRDGRDPSRAVRHPRRAAPRQRCGAPSTRRSAGAWCARPKPGEEPRSVLPAASGEMRRDGQLPYGWLANSTRWQRKPQTHTGLERMLGRTRCALPPGPVGGPRHPRRGLVGEGQYERRGPRPRFRRARRHLCATLRAWVPIAAGGSQEVVPLARLPWSTSRDAR